MRLVDYPLKDEIVQASIAYERETKSSLNTLVEDFLEDFLIKKGYLGVNLPVENVKTPKEIQSERKKQFKKQKYHDKCQIKFKELNFGSFKQDTVDDILDKLSRCSDDELEKISKSNWAYPNKFYHEFLFAWIKDDSITPESFIESINIIDKQEYKQSGRTYVRLSYNGKQIVRMNMNKYSKKEVELVMSYLNAHLDEISKIIQSIPTRKPRGEYFLKLAKEWKVKKDLKKED